MRAASLLALASTGLFGLAATAGATAGTATSQYLDNIVVYSHLSADGQPISGQRTRLGVPLSPSLIT